MKNEKLDLLVSSGDVVSYIYESLDDSGKLGEIDYRNFERLILVFPSGKKIVLGSLCSGLSEKSTLMLEVV